MVASCYVSFVQHLTNMDQQTNSKRSINTPHTLANCEDNKI